jgi:carboxyl-terminal processing protease
MMSSCQRWIATVLLVCVIAATAFAAGFGIGSHVLPSPMTPSSASDEKVQGQFRVFWQAWDVVTHRFYTEEALDTQGMAYGAIRGMVESLGDRHTVFLTPEQADLFREDLEGEFGGIGVTIAVTEEGWLRIVKPIPDSPGARAGLRTGDVILEVDGIWIQGMDLVQAINLIRGPEGSEVHLKVRSPDGQESDVVVVRARIEVPTTESRMLDEGIAYLAVYDCNALAPRGVQEGLDDLLESSPVALVLDLRGNPGGYLHVAKEIANEFVDEGLLLIERDSSGRETTHRASRGGRATDIPLAVLVDAGSASAAEIIAGAIQDNGRGVLVGTATFGKGSVQVTERLSDDSALQVTIRRWYTPADRLIEGQGLAPDVEVVMSDEDILAGRDPQLERAISYLLSQFV